MPHLDLAWCQDQLTQLEHDLTRASGSDVPELAVEVAALLEVAAEEVQGFSNQIQALIAEIHATDTRHTERGWDGQDQMPGRQVVRMAVPWRVRRQALGWLWRPYLQRPKGLDDLRADLEDAAMRAHAEACSLRGVDAAAPQVTSMLLALIAQSRDLVLTHLDELDVAARCVENLEIILASLRGETVVRRPQALQTRAPDPVRAAARAVVPFEARKAALEWLWAPHLASAA